MSYDFYSVLGFSFVSGLHGKEQIQLYWCLHEINKLNVV